MPAHPSRKSKTQLPVRPVSACIESGGNTSAPSGSRRDLVSPVPSVDSQRDSEPSTGELTDASFTSASTTTAPRPEPSVWCKPEFVLGTIGCITAIVATIASVVSAAASVDQGRATVAALQATLMPNIEAGVTSWNHKAGTMTIRIKNIQSVARDVSCRVCFFGTKPAGGHVISEVQYGLYPKLSSGSFMDLTVALDFLKLPASSLPPFMLSIRYRLPITRDVEYEHVPYAFAQASDSWALDQVTAVSHWLEVLAAEKRLSDFLDPKATDYKVSLSKDSLKLVP